MKKVIFLFVFLAACQTSVVNLAAPQEFSAYAGNGKIYRAGDVISQSVRNLGDGFYAVYKEVANSPEHWEAIAHYNYLYYGETEVCRCNRETVKLSNDRKFITYPKEGELGFEQLNLVTMERIVLE